MIIIIALILCLGMVQVVSAMKTSTTDHDLYFFQSGAGLTESELVVGNNVSFGTGQHTIGETNGTEYTEQLGIYYIGGNFTEGDTTDTTSPGIRIDQPTGTFDSEYDIPLNYTIDETPDTCWYSLNSGANLTIIGCNNITFNGSVEGSNTLTLYVNDSSSNNGSNTTTYNINTQNNTLQVFPTEDLFNTTTEINITSMCRYTNGTDCDNLTYCRLTVYYPNETLLLENGFMEFEGDGLYTYNLSYTNLTINATNNLIGEYTSSVACYDGDLQESAFTFRVVLEIIKGMLNIIIPDGDRLPVIILNEAT